MSWDDDLLGYLESAGLLESRSGAIVEPVGDGNINRVRRVTAREGRSMVVKHAGDFVERFPEHALSSDRIVFEQRYGEAVRMLAPRMAGVLPRVLHFEERRRILVMEDLGGAPRQDQELLAGRVDLSVIRRLGAFLGSVHAASVPHLGALRPRFRNDEMWSLHGGLLLESLDASRVAELAPGLRRLMESELGDRRALERISGLRSRHEKVREALVHGDVKAANVIIRHGRPFLLDAEFAHIGDPAFDLGTALAHLWLHLDASEGAAGHGEVERVLQEGYGAGGGSIDALWHHALRWAGVDIIGHVVGPMRLGIFRSETDAEVALRRGIRLLMD